MDSAKVRPTRHGGARVRDVTIVRDGETLRWCRIRSIRHEVRRREDAIYMQCTGAAGGCEGTTWFCGNDYYNTQTSGSGPVQPGSGSKPKFRTGLRLHYKQGSSHRWRLPREGHGCDTTGQTVTLRWPI